jgi:hypothetical protein
VAISPDTSAAAAAIHEDAYRELGPAGRLRIALELSDFTHALAVAGIRSRHPEYTDEEARRRLAEILYAAESTRSDP